MGFESFKAMFPDIGVKYDLLILVRDSDKNHKLFDQYKNKNGLIVKYGDLLNKEDVSECIRLGPEAGVSLPASTPLNLVLEGVPANSSPAHSS